MEYRKFADTYVIRLLDDKVTGLNLFQFEG